MSNGATIWTKTERLVCVHSQFHTLVEDEYVHNQQVVAKTRNATTATLQQQCYNSNATTATLQQQRYNSNATTATQSIPVQTNTSDSLNTTLKKVTFAESNIAVKPTSPPKVAVPPTDGYSSARQAS